MSGVAGGIEPAPPRIRGAIRYFNGDIGHFLVPTQKMTGKIAPIPKNQKRPE